jgi:hypothetical protein
MDICLINGKPATEEEVQEMIERRGRVAARMARNRGMMPLPVAQRWPTVLLPLKVMAVPEDRGAGDIIARVIGPIGGDTFKIWYRRLFGRSCGCGNRQEVLNRRWPL